MGWNNTMKTILLIIGFCVEVACYTAILTLYDWKAFINNRSKSWCMSCYDYAGKATEMMRSQYETKKY